MRSLRRGWASPPLQGQALGRLEKWVRFASIFPLSWLPPCPLRWDSEDASLSFSPPSGQPRIQLWRLSKILIFSIFEGLRLFYKLHNIPQI